ncbi:DUF2497 domain-containing protein [Aureimonas phyllosphaerae]|uniref:DUF2497 domain-containing protein n=1 Tax=Aureimonas phyllosphaerae TaxID=1166078 RepID=UPI003A5BA7FC
MDEILASIRRIIETGDEKSASANREAAVGAARQIPAFLAGASFQESSAEPPAQDVSQPLRFPSPLDSVHAGQQGSLGDDDHLTAELENELAATWERIEIGQDVGAPQPDAAPSQTDRFSKAEAPVMSQDQHPHFETPAAPAEHPQFQHGADAPSSQSPQSPASYEAPMERSAFEPANTDARRADEGSASSSRYGDVPPPLVSPTTGQLVGASFNELAEAIRQGELRSLEAMAQEMLQPMLRDWLDDNLPKMVERLIREEIERLARGGIKR